jgi:hypothetical protein
MNRAIALLICNAPKPLIKRLVCTQHLLGNALPSLALTIENMVGRVSTADTGGACLVALALELLVPKACSRASALLVLPGLSGMSFEPRLSFLVNLLGERELFCHVILQGC